MPSSVPVSALRNPPLYRDTVGNDGLAGGTPQRFGGQWDIVSEKVEPWKDPTKGQRVVKKELFCAWREGGSFPLNSERRFVAGAR